MNSESHTNSESHLGNHVGNPDEATSERCLRYLLGELSSEQATQFEQELGGSAKLGDELQRQSELLCLASQATIEPQQSLAVSNQVATDSLASDSAAKWIEAIAALAACLLVAFIGWNLSRSANTTTAIQEDVLIAQAWADTNDIALGLLSDEIEFETDGDFEIDSQNADESLSWVVTAVESGVSIDG